MIALVLALAVAETFAFARYSGWELSYPSLQLLLIWLALFSVQALVYGIWIICIKPVYLSPFKHLPGPKGGSFWNGHFRQQFFKGNGEQDELWMNEIPNDGLLYYRGLLNTNIVQVTSPTALATITTHDFVFRKPASVSGLAQKLLGLGLVLSEGDLHKQQRKTFLPAFAPKHIRELYPTYWAKAREVTKKLTALATENAGEYEKGSRIAEFEVGDWASRVALDIIGLSAMNVDFDSVEHPDSPLSQKYSTVLQPTRAFLMLGVAKTYFGEKLVESLPLKWNHIQQDASATIRSVARNLLHDKQRKLEGKNNDDKDIISVALRYGELNNVGEEEVMDQMTTFLAAGHETISVGITWTIYMMCLNPEWQKRIRAEIRSKFPSPSNAEQEATSTMFDEMPLLRAFIEESLRWYPPIPTTLRENIEPFEVDGTLCPKGTRFVIPIRGINHLERFWGADAKVFKPERWLKNGETEFDATGGMNSKYGMMTFNQGPRGCVAKDFSKAEMACVLSAWLGRFDFTLKDEKYLDEKNMKYSSGSFSSKPLHGLDVRARILDDW